MVKMLFFFPFTEFISDQLKPRRRTEERLIALVNAWIQISAKLGSWLEIDVQRYSFKPILQALFPNFSSAHFCSDSCFYRVEEWWYELENSRTLFTFEQKSWKLFDKKFKPLSHHILLDMPSLENMFKNAGIVLSAVWSATGSMHTNLEYLSTRIKKSFPCNSNRLQPSVSQGLAHIKSFLKLADCCLAENCCKFHSSCIVAWYLHLFQARRHRF